MNSFVGDLSGSRTREMVIDDNEPKLIALATGSRRMDRLFVHDFNNLICRDLGYKAATSGLPQPILTINAGMHGHGSNSVRPYGRFEATLQATSVSGLVTGFFLHRDSPRQEIDVEITGNRPDRLLVNVFYNPGPEGAKFDYGYRGTPVAIPLEFDASESAHRFGIEWDPCEIRWFIDGELVHRRVAWNPTPIPNLPMTLHVNTWPTRSRELAGRLARRCLPASAIVRSISVDAFDASA